MRPDMPWARPATQPYVYFVQYMMQSLANLVLGTDMTGAPGYCTAPPPSEQWGTSPGLPGGVQYPIRSNGENNGALEQFEPFNDPRLDPNGRYGPAGGYQVYPSDNNMPEDPYNLHWSQTPY